MQKREYILVETSALLRKGIKAALDEVGVFRLAEAMDNISGLAASIIENKPALVIVNAGGLPIGALAQELANVPLSILPKVAIICKNTDRPKTKYAKFVIPLYANEQTLSKIIKQITDAFSDGQHEDKDSGITNRESTVLREIALGYTNKETAEKLFISQHTVITHRKNITRKLGIKSVSGLTVYAILNKIITPDEVG